MTHHLKLCGTATGFLSCSRLATLCALTVAVLVAAPAAAQAADPARGRALYENHCIACHTARIHSRPNRIAITREDVREIVEQWRREQNLTWSAQDTEDVVEFLGRTQYHFAPAKERLGQR